MKERPILFSGPMVRAILDGRKTQTRRVVKQVPSWQHCGKDIMEWGLSGCYSDEGTHWLDIQTEVDDNSHTEIFCPYGALGDQLWVRETWGPCAGGVVYRADGGTVCPDGGKWKPSIFMPRWASRISLEIEAVMVERLNEISEDDAKAEGASYHNSTGGIGQSGWRHDYSDVHADARSSFARLWESINGPGSWELNPWVWVIQFRRVKP